VLPLPHAVPLILAAVSGLLIALTGSALSQTDAYAHREELDKRITAQLQAIERLLPTLRHVAVTTEEGAGGRTRLSSEAWFVPGDAVETPVKVVLSESGDGESRETHFWLDQGRLFFVLERIKRTPGGRIEVTERTRSYDGTRLYRLRSGITASELGLDQASQQTSDLELPADAETEGTMMEEIALETASRLAPVIIPNRPVRWPGEEKP
jgi:hypothetical protein